MTKTSNSGRKKQGPLVDLPRHVLDNLREGCQVIARDFTYLYLNDAAAEQGRRAKEDLLGQKMTVAYPGIDRTPFWPVLLRAMEGTAHEWLENLFTYPDGVTAWFELRFVPIPEGVFILSLDTTSRKEAEASRVFLAAAMDQSAEAVYITDPKGQIKYVNPAFERITGYTRAEALGKNARILKSGDHGPLFYETMWLTLGEGKVWRGRMINRRKDGTKYPQDGSISPVHDLKGELVSYVAVTRDLSSELKLETHLQQVQRLESIGRLAGGIAHDFNNLLFVIQSYSDVLLESLPKGSQEHEDVQEIHDAGKRAVALVRQLLAFSRKQVMQPVPLDLNGTVQGMETLLGRVIGEDVILTVALAPDLGVTLADPSQLEQVVMNLAVNARDAMPKGGELLISTANVEIDENYAEQHLT
ncbi:MAG: PAS domain S-box protein, partial [Gemmatimonadota bacterium]